MTIYALSTGPGISGIAVIRISGEETQEVIKLLTGKDIPKPRVATLRKPRLQKKLLMQRKTLWKRKRKLKKNLSFPKK